MDPTTPNTQRLQAWHAFGLGFTPFAHHYLGHLLRFLFLRLLRCFTSPGCRPRKGRMDCSMQVSPFRYPRITGCLLLPAAFRSWLRLSSASGAKAFPACPLYLNLINPLLTFSQKKRVSGCVTLNGKSKSKKIFLFGLTTELHKIFCCSLERR